MKNREAKGDTEMQSLTIAITICSWGLTILSVCTGKLLGQEKTEKIIIKKIRAMIVIVIKMHDSKRSD